MIFIGMDNGRVSHQYVVVNEQKERLKHGPIPNESWAFEAWCEHIDRTFPGHDIVVGLEEGGGMSSPFDGVMQSFGWCVRELSPRAVRTYREDVLRIHDKTDDTDAYTQAIMVATHADTYRVLNQERAPLRRATRWRDKLVGDKTALVNELRAVLALYWPETAGSKVFSEMSSACKWVWLVLEHYPDPVTIVKEGAQNLLSFFRKHKSPVSRDTVEALVALAWKNTAFAPDKAFLLQQTAQLAKLLRQLDSFKLETEAAIVDMTKDDVDVQSLDAIRGVSTVQAAGFMAEVRAFERFEDDSHLASYSGVALKKVQTGISKNTRRPQRSANRRLKKCLLGIAQTMSMNDERSKAYYSKKIKEGKKHDQALTALARHVVRRFYKLLRQNHKKHVLEGCPQESAAVAGS